RAGAVASAGARGVAVIGAILGSDDPERAAANLRMAIGKVVSDHVP
ncbi:MAG TPA: thiamine phosphate synthase, partial [Dehalococcoidia bacterium]|nr:thiamine phosphate synthase [Dehalococcoidia bacterium]